MKKLILILLGVMALNALSAQIEKTDSIYNIWDQVGEMAFKDNYLYVKTENGFRVIDYTDVADPVVVSQFHDQGNFNSELIKIEGNYLYSNFLDGIEIFDITNRQNPGKIGEITKQKSPIIDFLVVNNHVYCIEYRRDPIFGNVAWLVTHDVTDKSTPVYKNSEEIGSYGSISDFTTGNHIYVKKITGTYPQVATKSYVYSIASPAFPTNLGETSYFPDYDYTHYYENDTLYMHDESKLFGLNLTNPLEPDTFAIYGFDGQIDGLLSVSGDNIIGYSGRAGRLYSTNNTNTASLVSIFDMPKGQMQFKTIKDNRLYYAQNDSAKIINLPLFSENQPDTLFDEIFYNLPLDLNDFTVKNLEGDTTWLLETYMMGDGEEFTEASLNIPSTNGLAHQDWLISPQVELPNTFQHLYLSFYDYLSWEDCWKDWSVEPNYCQVLVSENYDGMNPEAASWTVMNISYQIGGAEENDIDLSDFAGKSIHLAFKFENPADVDVGWMIWRVKNIKFYGLNSVNVAGSDCWRINGDELTVEEENGYLSYEVNEDWLTTSAISLTGYSNYYVNFHRFARLQDKNIFGVYVSENYDGISPGSADWTEIEAINWPERDPEYLYSGSIDISAFAGKTIHIGFKYITTENVRQRWYIKDVKVLGSNGYLPHHANELNMNPDYYAMPKIDGVQVSGNQAYVSHKKGIYEDIYSHSFTFRFSAVDITDRKNIIEKSHLTSEPYISSEMDYYVQDSLLAVHWNETATTLYRYDVNDTFVEKGTFANSDARFYYTADNHAVVGLSDNVYRIYDITDENNPLPVFQFTNTYKNFVSIDEENKHLYLVVLAYNPSVIEKWDISDITAPEKLESYTLPARSFQIFYKDSVLYNYSKVGISGTNTRRWGKITANKISGSEFVEVGSYEAGSPAGFDFNDNYAFLGVSSTNEGSETGVHVISLQNPDSLECTYLLPDKGGLLDVSVNNSVVTAAYTNTIELYDLNSIPLPPEQFNLISPQGEVSTTDTLLKWEPCVDPNGNNPEYEIRIAANEDFTDAFVDTTSETTYPVGNLLPGQEFYWKVIALDEYTDNVPANQTFQFSLPEIELIAPEGEVANTATALTWQQVVKPNGSPLNYEVLFANDSNFTNPDTLVSADTVLAMNDLLPGQYYYWKVRAKNNIAASSWSPQYKNFSVAVPSATQVHAKDLGSSAETGVTMLDEGIIYTASSSSVHRFNGSGDQQYTLQVNGQIKSSTTITPDHRVYIASTDNNLYAFNQNGVSIDGWPVALGAQLEASVAIDDDHRMYLGTSNGIFQCISANGSVQWSYNVGAAVKASSAISANDTLYIINTNGRMLAFDLENLDAANPQPAWVFETGHPISNSPAIVDNHIFVTSDDGYLLKIQNKGNAVELVFETATNGSSYSSPVVDATNAVYFAADSGMVYAINGETGSLKWKSPTYYTRSAPEAIRATGALSADGMFYIGDTHGVIYGLSTADGAILWSHRGAEAPVSGALLYNAYQLYYTARSQMICLAEPTLKIAEMTKREVPYWATFQGNNQRTGNPDEIALIQMFEVILSADPGEGGTVEGAGSFAEDAAITVTATPDGHYNFINWTENGTQVSTNATYSFTVNENRNLVAHFEPKTYDISSTVNPANSGTITGTGNYTYGETAELSASPESGYTFVNWTEDGSQVAEQATYSFTVTGNQTLVANFEQQTFDIFATVNPANSGTITGTGNYTYDETVVITVTPEEGYEFINWTEGGSQVSEQETYSFYAVSERTLTANLQFVTGVDDSADVGLKVYPNPTKHLVKVESGMNDIRSIRFIDISGQTVLLKQCSGNRLLTIDLPGLTEGMYILEIATSTSVEQTRLMIH